MPRMNRVCLIGQIIQEPRIRYPNNGVAVYRCLLRIERPNAKRALDPDKRFDDINVIVWGEQAERAHRHTQKGSIIGVEGYIHSRRYSKVNQVDEADREKLLDLVLSFSDKSTEEAEAVVDEILDIVKLNGHVTEHVAYEVVAAEIEFLANCVYREEDRELIPLIRVVQQKVDPALLRNFLMENGYLNKE